MCRSSTDAECDLPEFCNGSSSFCQSDVFVQVSVSGGAGEARVPSLPVSEPLFVLSERPPVPEPAGLLLQRQVSALRRTVSGHIWLQYVPPASQWF